MCVRGEFDDAQKGGAKRKRKMCRHVDIYFNTMQWSDLVVIALILFS